MPKTIDNDVGDSEFKLIDHTPGYGSVAKYWMHMVQNANEENAGSLAGRSGAGDAGDGPQDRLHSGRRPAGRSRAARCRCKSTWPRAPARSSRLADQVNDQLRQRGRCMVVVSEGFDVGELGEVKDSFGHTMFSSSQIDRGPGRGQLPEQGRPGGQGGRPRQRAGHRSAALDGARLDRRSGRSLSRAARWRRCWPPAARAASWRRSCATRARSTACATTRCRWPRWPTASGRFPAEWIAENGYDVTDDFVRYAKPLVGEDMVSMPLIDGRQRMTRFQPIYAKQKLPKYVPQADRKK